MQSSKIADPIKRQRSTSRSASPSSSPREPVPTWTDSSRKKRVASADDPTPRTQRNIPAFLNKLYSMVDDDSTNDMIRWSTEGNSFIVEQHELFSKTVLPRFYKHNTFSSFVRQLNMYDFHKVPHLQQGVMLVDSEHELWEFSHPNFQRNQYELLHLVVRKRIRNNNDQQLQQPQSQQASPLPTSSLQHQSIQQSQQLLSGQHLASLGDSSVGPPRLNALGDTSMQLEYVRLGSLVKDISTIRQHQHAISTDLQHLHNDNEILWRETLLAREKHQRHQQVIERILLFLTSVFSPDDNPGISPKQSRYMLRKQDEKVIGSQTGNLDSIAASPGHLIEEAVKLAGISTTSLQKKRLDQDIGTTDGEIEGSHSPTTDQQTSVYHHRHQQNQGTTTLQQHQHQHQQQNSQVQGQDKGKLGMYGKGGMDPSFLMNALKDLYSIRDTFTSISSNPHGMESSAMNPSSSRSEQANLHSGYHHSHDHNYPQPQQNYRQHSMYNQQNHVSTTGSNNMTMFGHSNEHDDPDRTIATVYTSANNIKTSTALAPTATNPLLGFPNLHASSAALSGLTGNSGGGVGGIGGGGGDNETHNVTRIVGLAESLHTATRSAEAISQDIDDLQISIESLAATMGLDTNGAEGFDGYIDEFTDNYSNMISLATKNDKMQLFQLAGDSNAQDKYDNQHHSQQQHQNNNSSNNASSHIDRKFTDIPPHTAPDDV